MVPNSDGTYSLWSLADDLYVSAELGYSGSDYGMLRARATSIGPWEEFTAYGMIRNVLDGNNFCMDANSGQLNQNGTRVALWGCNAGATETNQQAWGISPNGDGTYTIRNGADPASYCLDANAQQLGTDGASVTMWTCNGGNNQKWTITPIYDQTQWSQYGVPVALGSYVIRNLAAGDNFCLDADTNAFQTNDDRIRLWTCGFANQQVWRL